MQRLCVDHFLSALSASSFSTIPVDPADPVILSNPRSETFLGQTAAWPKILLSSPHAITIMAPEASVFSRDAIASVRAGAEREQAVGRGQWVSPYFVINDVPPLTELPEFCHAARHAGPAIAGPKRNGGGQNDR
jgi:hypothetical protein